MAQEVRGGNQHLPVASAEVNAGQLVQLGVYPVQALVQQILRRKKGQGDRVVSLGPQPGFLLLCAPSLPASPGQASEGGQPRATIRKHRHWYYKGTQRASLVAQWLRICLSMQGTPVRALVWEDPTCRGATRPVSHNY